MIPGMDPYKHPLFKVMMARLDQFLQDAPQDLLETVGEAVQREIARRRETIDSTARELPE